jgi:hypothetical protein
MKSRESRQVTGAIQRITGRRYPKVEQLVEGADLETRLQVLALLRDVESAISNEKRTFRPFPGGPRMRG